MGDKKGKKKGGGEEDESTLQLSRLYKKKCEYNGVPISKLFKEKLDYALEEEENIIKIHMWEEIGPVGIRALMDAMTEISYQHTKSIRLWKVKAQDEGTRTICNYMEKVKTLEILDLMDNQIGPLGCEFLGRVLSPAFSIPLIKLKLDHNDFGTKGLEQLAQGLAQNNILEKLSLNYCNITEEGSKYIQQILSYINTNLKKLKMRGNILKNNGINELFKVFKINQMLEKVDLADNQFNTQEETEEDKQVIDRMCDVFQTAENLLYYDFKFNNISEEDAQRIIQCIEQNKAIYFLELSENIPQELIEKKKNLMKKRKPKKKKKKKKKK